MTAATLIAPFLPRQFNDEVLSEVNARREAVKQLIRNAASERGDEVRFIRVSNRVLTSIAESLKDDFGGGFRNLLMRRGVGVAITSAVTLLGLLSLVSTAISSGNAFAIGVFSTATFMGAFFCAMHCLEDNDGPLRRARFNLEHIGDHVWALSEDRLYVHRGNGSIRVAQLRGIGEIKVVPSKGLDMSRVAVMDLAGGEIARIASPEMDDRSEDAIDLPGRSIARYDRS